MYSILLSELLLSDCPIESTFILIAANDTRRCPTCYTWYIHLDSPRSNSSYPKGLRLSKHCSNGPDQDMCPQCHRESTDLALAKRVSNPTAHQSRHQPKQHTAEALAATQALRTSHPPELRRYMARRDVKLYQALRASGSNLSALPPRCSERDQGIDSLLNQKQERALFQALQALNAFRCPGMAEYMRDREGRRLPDEKIFEFLRQSDCRWNIDRGWLKDGQRVYFETPTAVCEREVRVARGRKATRWDTKRRVSGRRLPRRMERADFQLRRIVEID